MLWLLEGVGPEHQETEEHISWGTFHCHNTLKRLSRFFKHDKRMKVNGDGQAKEWACVPSTNCHHGRGRARRAKSSELLFCMTNQVMSVHQRSLMHGTYSTTWYHTVQIKHLSFCSRVGTLHLLASCQAHASGCTQPAPQCRASALGRPIWPHVFGCTSKEQAHASSCCWLLLEPHESSMSPKTKSPSCVLQLMQSALSRHWIGKRLIFLTTWPSHETDGQKKKLMPLMPHTINNKTISIPMQPDNTGSVQWMQNEHYEHYCSPESMPWAVSSSRFHLQTPFIMFMCWMSYGDKGLNDNAV
jgi:hypothetical protein